MPRSNVPELMSPAGSWPQLKAAIQAGADAVYFGLNHFSARAKVGFSVDELPEVFRTLHRQAVQGFVTFNTLVFDHELELAADAIAAIADSGADAIIVQDVGVARLAARIAPELDIHGSTQMSVTSAEGAELAAEFGCSRVVLGRELDLRDIRRIAQSTDVELEVFVHGALCVSYSGQCFSSEAWGGRSANRGQCAQACRLSYDLIVDGKPRDVGPARYLLSPGDLYAIEQVPELIDIGVACLKIEGRYKDEDYVTLTTRAYRDAIDRAVAGAPGKGRSAVTREELEQIYSRGLGPHFLAGTNHQQVVDGRVPRHRGRLLGPIVDTLDDALILATRHPLAAGAGVVIDSSDWRSPDEPEEGGHVFVSENAGPGRLRLKFARGKIDFARIRIGDRIWQTNDPLLRRKSRNLRRLPPPTTAIDFRVVACRNRPLLVEARTSRGEEARYDGCENLAEARNNALSDAILREQLGRLGGSPFHLSSIDFVTDASLFCPVSVLNLARRTLIEQLIEGRQSRRRKRTRIDQPITGHLADQDMAIRDPQLHVLVRTPEQLDAAIGAAADSITLDYLDLYGLRTSVERIQAAGITARVASPRILKPNEQNVIRFLLSLKCQILIRSGGLLHDLVNRSQGTEPLLELFGDFSLNAANVIACQSYLDMGLQRLTPTHDLNAEQVRDLAAAIAPAHLEPLVYHHLPVFHMEHCVFCRFLSNGTDNTNCGHPCEKHQVVIRDGEGRQHPVLADIGCRNTVFNAEVQTASRYLNQWVQAGIHHFRLEFVHQPASVVQAVCQAFRDFFGERMDARTLDQILGQHSVSGTTDGSLFVPKDFKRLVQLT